MVVYYKLSFFCQIHYSLTRFIFTIHFLCSFSVQLYG
jgi:hypothetical protein